MHRIFAPLSIAGMLGDFLAGEMPWLRLLGRTRLEKLDAADLRCVSVSVVGSDRDVRAPYAFPFFPEELALASDLPPADWLYLGGDPGRFAAALGRALSRDGRNVALYIPFAKIAGTLGRTGRPGEPRLATTMGHENYNQPAWTENREALLATPEDKWCELGLANTLDCTGHFAPWLTKVRDREPRLILDLGCGLGQTARTLADMFPKSQVVGLDSSKEAVSVAGSVFRRDNLSFRTHAFDGALPFDDASAGLIVSVNALPYAANQRSFARDVFRTLAPDGALFNFSRMLPSQLAMDFPACLLCPRDHQFDPWDWEAPARERGFRLAVSQGPAKSLSSDYLVAGKYEDFADAYRAAIAGAPDFGAYRPWHSHAVTVAARDPSPGDSLAAVPGSHLGKLEAMLDHADELPEPERTLAHLSWKCAAQASALLPEAYGFITACLPDRAPLFSPLFPQGEA